jgi:predicted Zn finger-like uncharacterized protein
MIVTCPACQTRYLVDDAAFGANIARRVRCANCGNLWRFSPEKAAVQGAVPDVTVGAGAVVAAAASTDAASADAVPEPVAPLLRAEPGTRLSFYPREPTVQERPSFEAEGPAVGRRRSATFAIVAIIILAAILVIVAILARGKIMALWPPLRPALAKLHLVERPSNGLPISSMLGRGVAVEFAAD